MLPAGKPRCKACLAPAPDLTPAPALAYVATHKINAAIFWQQFFWLDMLPINFLILCLQNLANRTNESVILQIYFF
jgi:hypothetical protein